MKNSIKFIFVIGSAFLVLLISLFFYSGYRVAVQQKEMCEEIKAVAADTEKVNYLSSWMSTKLNDRSFLKLMGWNGVIRLSDSPELLSKLNLDWTYLGLDSRFGYVEFNRHYKERDNYLDFKTVKSVTFGQGRFSVIIKSDGSSEYGLYWPANELQKIQKINDRVAVRCE